jgi:predicted metal-dependent phosphoesterase TrpH
MLKIRFDSHCHTLYSDGCVGIQELVTLAKEKHFHLITKTDHNTTRGNEHLKRLAERNCLLFIPGVEISTNEGHLLAYGLMDWKRPDGGKGMQEQIDKVLELGGAPVIAHPYWRGGLGEGIFNLKRFLGFEMLNHASPFGSLKLLKKAAQKPELYNKFGKYAGSDSHAGKAYGYYYTEIKVDNLSASAVMEGIFKQKVNYYGPMLDIGLWWEDGKKNQIYQLKRQILKQK